MTNILLALACLLSIESGGNDYPPDGDGGRAVGCLQIWPIMVAECNRIAGVPDRWTLDDRRDPQESRQMALVFLRYHYRRGVTDPAKLALRWNRPGGQDNEAYRRRIERWMEARR